MQRRPPPCRRDQALETAAATQASLALPAARCDLSALDSISTRPATAGHGDAHARSGPACILSSCRKALLADWRLAAVNVWQTAGMLSDWLRECDPMVTREDFAARRCHRRICIVVWV